MTRVPERSVGVAVMALLALTLLGASLSVPWFEYDATTGRQTPPGGPYNDGEDGVVRQHLTVWAASWSGDVEPDAALSAAYALWVPAGLALAMGACLAAAAGEIPSVHRWIHRRAALGLLTVALGAVLAVTAMSWVWMPGMLEAHHVDSQFAAGLDEQYTESNLGAGWYLMSLSVFPVIAAGLFKFQAGAADLDTVKQRLEQEASG